MQNIFYRGAKLNENYLICRYVTNKLTLIKCILEGHSVGRMVSALDLQQAILSAERAIAGSIPSAPTAHYSTRIWIWSSHWQ